MAASRNIGFFVLALGVLVVALSPRRRGRVSRTLADARRFASRRIVDRDARVSPRAVARWENEGGAMNETRGDAG